MAEQKYAIEVEGITKRFGDVVANDSISLNVKKGEILALLGENGSGKTTLMNMLSGIYKPDGGIIKIAGQEVTITTPEDSKRLHIGMVHQHFKLVDKFSAADNIWISAEKTGAFLTKDRYKKIDDICKKFGFDLDPKKLVSDMSVSEKQTVEIIKVLYNGADILILDEPTATLTLQETRKLFSILRRMRDAGAAIIIITHKLNEVLEISDRVTILRKGKSITTVNTAETNANELTELMVGHAVTLSIDRPVCVTDKALLEIENLTVKDSDGATALDDVSLKVMSGEILGIAGVSGCGQKELCEAVAGIHPIVSGSILYKGEHIESCTPREIINRGISMSFIPEDRLGMGLAASLSITDNMMLKNYCDTKGPFVDRKKAAVAAKKVVDDLGVVTPGIDYPVRRLSGGNVQKVLVGREMLAGPNVLITAYPVRGLDINSSYTIYNILNDEKQKGTGILFVGEDLDVMLGLCDRIVVLCHGRVTGIVDAKTATKEQLGLLMTDAASSDKDSLSHQDDNAGASIDKNTELFASSSASDKKVKNHTPVFRVSKRKEPSHMKAAALYAFSLLLAIVLGGIFIAVNGVNPLKYYETVVTGCFKTEIYIRAFIRIIIPLIITSLGIAFAFKMRFWNIGANGQFIVGAIGAATVGLALGDSLDRWLVLLLMAVAGALLSGLFGLIPAFFKVKFGTSETLLTLMLNYIAYYILTYLKNLMFYRKVSETGGVYRPDFKILPENAWLYDVKIGGVSIDISFFIALILVVFTFIYFKYTKHGYEITVVGDSRNTANYAGMKVNKIVLRTMFISAAVVGLGGMLQVSGSATNHTLADGITSDVGWTGIIVAWLAKLNPIGIFAVSLMMGILEKGTSVAESTFNISSAASDVLQGIILFSVLAMDFFMRYKINIDLKRKGGRG